QRPLRLLHRRARLAELGAGLVGLLADLPQLPVRVLELLPDRLGVLAGRGEELARLAERVEGVPRLLAQLVGLLSGLVQLARGLRRLRPPRRQLPPGLFRGPLHLPPPPPGLREGLFVPAEVFRRLPRALRRGLDRGASPARGRAARPRAGRFLLFNPVLL